MPILRFGGDDDIHRGQEREQLGELTADDFDRLFRFWLDRVWINGDGVPVSSEQLASFDQFGLIPEFCACYDDVEIPVRGKTLEEMWLSVQLVL